MMSPGVNTPFIPPLHTPAAHAAVNLPPQEPPVLPGHRLGGAYPNWPGAVQHPSAGGYHRAAYTAPPYISGPSTLPLASHTPGSATGAYLPASPAYPPLLQRPVIPHPRDPGVSSDYIGYPSLPNSPAALPIGIQPSTPYQPMSVPLQGQAGSWGARPAHYPTMTTQPMSAGPAYPAFPFSPQGPPPWAVPPPHATPAAPYAMPLDPYAAPHTPWGPPAHFMQPPILSQQPAHHHPHLPQHIAAGVTPATLIGDRMPPFAVGRNYGPVLEPFLLRVVGAKLKINPLLEPLPETGEDRPHLKWMMLFKTNACQLSTDPGHVSWCKGRDEPATFPRVTKISLVSETFPWMVTVHASDPDIGVTCGELIDGLSDNLHKLTSAADYQAAPDGKKQTIGEAYRFNRSRASGVPGGRLGDGLRRMDFLCRDVVFGGVYQDYRLVKKLIGEATPATFVLRCTRQYALTQEELREHEARERMAEDRERKKTRAETISSDTISDDDLT